MRKKIGIIGSGFAGLSAACYLAKQGHEVFILEKNDTTGGRARQLKLSGFTFDMGPSWYWMPDVFERFFSHFEKTPADYYDLIRLDPSYRVKFRDQLIDLPASIPAMEELFEQLETGSARRLRLFLDQAAYKYQVGIHQLVHQPGQSVTEFMDWSLIKGMLKMDVFTSMSTHIRKYFSHPLLIELLEFPVLFLGATPEKTPALYSLMNYADMALGTWYPMGGMHRVVEGMVKLATELGVTIHCNQEVTHFGLEKGNIRHLHTSQDTFWVDAVVSGADYHHTEQLLPEKFRNYSSSYWDRRVMAPSSLLFYLGLDKQLPNLLHHTLFFDEDFKQHAHEIYTDPQWPSKPLLYVSATSKTDSSVAPAGCENLVVLIPVAPDLKDTPETRNYYLDLVIDRLEKFTGISLRDHIQVQHSFAHRDFITAYHSYKGNAYGLANTLRQTALLKPSLKSRKLKNLYFTGQLTVPGPGVPPSLISGQVVANEIMKDFT